VDKAEILHEYQTSKHKYILTKDGKLFVDGVQKHWYYNEETGAPWMVRKFQTFKSLIIIGEKDGDYD